MLSTWRSRVQIPQGPLSEVYIGVPAMYLGFTELEGLLPNSTVLVLDAQLRAVYTTSKLN
jgi:hypothetical protein